MDAHLVGNVMYTRAADCATEEEFNSQLYTVSDAVFIVRPDANMSVVLNNVSDGAVHLERGEPVAIAELVAPCENGHNVNIVLMGEDGQVLPGESNAARSEHASKMSDSDPTAAPPGGHESNCAEELAPPSGLESNCSQQSEKSFSCFIAGRDQDEWEKILEGCGEGEDFPLPAGYELPGPEEDKPYDLSFSEVGKHVEVGRQAEIKALLQRHLPVFAKNAGNFGNTPLMKVKLEMTPGMKPVRQAYRPCAKAHEPFVRETLARLMRQGVIEYSESAWAANIVVVKRPRTTQLRLCVDLRQVNASTVRRNSWPINLVEESFERISRSHFRSKCDIISAYWSVALDGESSRDMTSFYGLGKLYRFIKSPYGIRDMPQYFNKLMSEILLR
jgi:hypothetical protein